MFRREKRHISQIFLAAGLLALPASAQAAVKLKPPVRGDRMTAHMSAKPGMIHPYLGHSTYDSAAAALVYETLLDLDAATNKWVGKLAKSWKVAPDGLSITVVLRPGMVWSDGKPVTAEDVKFSFDIIRDPKVDAAHLRNYFNALTSVTVTGKDTLLFKFKEPYFRSLIMIGLNEIMPKHIFGKGDFNKHPNNNKPIGSGPYLLESFKNNELRFKPNPRWWGLKTPYWKDRYNFKRRIYRIITDDNAALTEHKRGGIDTMSLTAKQWVRDTRGGGYEAKFKKMKYYPLYGNGYGYIGWNANPARKLPFTSAKVRTAMAMLLNRKLIQKNVYFNLASPAVGPFASTDPRVPKDIKPPPYNPAGAKKLLLEAGFADKNKDGVLEWGGKPFSFTLLMPSGNESGLKIAQIFKADLKKAGINMDLRELEWTVFLDKVTKNRDYDACMMGWGSSVDSDPYQIWHSSQIVKGDNFAYFKNARADELMSTARKTMDRKKRTVMYQEFSRILAKEQPYLFLFNRPSLDTVTRRFENTDPLLLGLDSALWFTPKAKQLE